jgi:hypothetical protein
MENCYGVPFSMFKPQTAGLSKAFGSWPVNVSSMVLMQGQLDKNLPI